ncbi:MAG: DUF3179 domain-containing (seleno)protein [Haloarculaceae archaeon]
MKRRRLLAFAGLGASASLAGCTFGYVGDRGRAATAGAPTSLPVPESELRRSAPRDGIPAITDPAFAPDWSDVAIDFGSGTTYRPRLADGDLVVGVARADVATDGTGASGETEPGARAYPLALLNWHEVVNDTLGGPLLVTYCPICRSGLVARRTVDGEVTGFGVSGLLYQENLVLYDGATGSLWSQILATAIRGPETGETLEVLPSTLTTWEEWRGRFPNGEVLLPPPLSDTVVGAVRLDYGFDLVGQARENAAYLEERMGDDFGDSRLPKRALVLGIAAGGAARAYPLTEALSASPVNDRVGGVPVVVVGRRGSAIAFDRRIDGRTLTFADAGPGHVRAGGSRWRVETGRAVDGPLAGTRLEQVNAHPPLFWFAWLDFHPGTSVWGRD